MLPVIEPVDRKILKKELTKSKYICHTRKGGNQLYEVTYFDSPNVMREIGRLRELTFRAAGGGTGKEMDIDEYDIDPVNHYRQLIVWDPDSKEIIGGYRYIACRDLEPAKMATTELFSFSEEFKQEYLPYTIELGRSFVQPNYQGININRKGLFALDNLWDGLAALMYKYHDFKYFFGKVTMYTTYNTTARNILLNFLHLYFPSCCHMVSAVVPLEYDRNNKEHTELFSGLEYSEAYKTLQKTIKNYGEFIPPLVNSYMGLSSTMKVFDTAINHTFGEVEETGILITIEDIYPEKLERHFQPVREILASFADKIRPKWWKKIPSLKRPWDNLGE